MVSRLSKLFLLLLILSSSFDSSSKCRRPRRIRAIKTRCIQVTRLLQARRARIRLLIAQIARLRSLTVRNNALIRGNLRVNGNEIVDGTQTVNGNQTVNGDQTVNGNQTVTGSINVSGNITAPNIGANFINAQKTLAQAISGSFANITGFSVVNNSNWGFNGNDTFTVPATGTYKIDYVAHILGSTLSLNPDTVLIRVLANGSQINASPTANSITVLSSTETLSQTFIVDLTAAQTITLQVVASSLLTTPSLSSTTISGATSPAVSLSIVQIK